MLFRSRLLLPVQMVLLAVVLPGREPPAANLGTFVDQHCLDCHDSSDHRGGLSLEGLDYLHPQANPEVWERVLRKLEHRLMPPVGKPRPDEGSYVHMTSLLTDKLDRAAAAHPQPGRTD